jgi:tetratricopeptide (TPR) repeat protein
MALSWSWFVARGPGAPERESALIRTRELCEQLGDDGTLMQTLLALAHHRFNQGEFGPARELAERVLVMAERIVMAERAEAPAIAAGAHAVIGFVRSSIGQFQEAREHLERAFELFGAGPHRDYGALFARLGPAFLTGVLAVLGYPSMALRKVHELLSAARRSSDASSIATALMSDLMRHVELRDSRMVAELADELLSIATEHAFPYFLIASTFFRGWAIAAAGRGEEGIAEMRRYISDPMAGAARATAQMLVALAETCGKNGRATEGLDLLAKGLATAEQNGERLAEAELHRLKGELLMIEDPGNLVEGERCLRTAIDVARRQGARLFELRATVSLARSLRDTNRGDEARKLLAEIYNWFTEGFDLPDLKEAKALLDELSR